MHSYLVAAGSNLGNRQETIECARAMIIERGLTIDAASELVEISSLTIIVIA